MQRKTYSCQHDEPLDPNACRRPRDPPRLHCARRGPPAERQEDEGHGRQAQPQAQEDSVNQGEPPPPSKGAQRVLGELCRSSRAPPRPLREGRHVLQGRGASALRWCVLSDLGSCVFWACLSLVPHNPPLYHHTCTPTHAHAPTHPHTHTHTHTHTHIHTHSSRREARRLERSIWVSK